ncbi:MAG: DUF4446 family protein [Blautia sp.]
MGGKLSFALAMLDKENNGFVMNAIHSSDGCYTLCKGNCKEENLMWFSAKKRRSSSTGSKFTQ